MPPLTLTYLHDTTRRHAARGGGGRRFLYLYILCAVLTLAACGGGGKADGWQELREEANELYNRQQFDEALAIYGRALEKADDDGRLKLRQDIIDCHLAVGHDHEARQMMLALMQDAAKQGNRYVEAETKFALGEQLCQSGDKAAGYPYMHEAVGLMSECKDSDAPYTLTFYHYRLMKRAAEDEDWPRAISESKLTEQVWRTLGDTARAERLLRPALALRAWFYLKTDSLPAPCPADSSVPPLSTGGAQGQRDRTREQLADETYRQWQQHLPCSIVEEYHINYYLTERGRYQEALDIYRRYEAYTLEKKGYWSMDEEEAKLNIADIYARMGDSARAFRLTKEAYAISDSMRVTFAEANAQELEAVYQNQAKTEQISRLRLWVAVLAVILAVFIGIALTMRIRIVRKRKDKTIAAVIKDMQASPSPSQGGDVEIHDSNTISASPSNQTSPLWEGLGEASRFSAFDTAVNQGRLYAKPEVTRDVLVELMGVDSNTFSRIIREQSGCQNLNDYLNRKRIDYACQLMRQHPNWTVETIAQDCGFQTVRTFNRVFKTAMDMTPMQYLSMAEGTKR